jgi:glutamate--cysteine ligase
VYMIDRHVIGGFYRVNRGRGIDENLNAPGMHFAPMGGPSSGVQPFSYSCSLPDCCASEGSPPNRFYSYGVVARLAQLAASIELQRTGHLLPERSPTGQE